MPRQANGTYLQPANTAAVTLTTISTTGYNTLDTDIGNEITNSLDRNGRGAMANDFDAGGFRVKNIAGATAGSDAISRNYLFNGTCITRSCSAGGAADAITGVFNPTVTSYFTGLTLMFKAFAANATTTTTFKADSMAAKTIYRRNNVNIGIGDIPGADYWVTLMYDAALAFGAGGWTLIDVNSIAIKSVTQQRFTSSGTYSPTSRMSICLIECWGGGGGGGSSVNSSGFGSGGGGGAGSYSRKTVPAATIGASQTVTIGAAGAAGGAGGATSVGGICIANGGQPGAAAGGANSAGAGGAGGTSGTGDEAFTGSRGCVGMAATSSTGLLSGSGGGTSLGNGGWGVTGSNTGVAPSEVNSGSGGSGGSSQGSGGGTTGGTGAKGYVRITEYLF